MGNLPNATEMMRKDCFMASVNLKYGCYSAPVVISDKKYLLFQFEGISYKHACLPNGLFSVPRMFAKFLKPVLSAPRKKVHQAINYLDDIFIVG